MCSQVSICVFLVTHGQTSCVISVWNKNIADEAVCLIKQEHQAHVLTSTCLVITANVYATTAEVTDPVFVSDR